MAAPTTRKSSRGEALKAYNEMAQRAKEEKEADLKTQKAAEEEKRTVQSALEEPDDAIVRSIADIKVQIAKALDEVAEKRTVEYKKLVEIEKAIAIESKNLEELHEITRNAETLTALVRAQEEQRRKFDEEMAEKKRKFDEDMSEARKGWDKERSAIEEEIEERRSRTERENKQEEDEYTYKTAKKRQAETDAWEAKKALLDKELAIRREGFEKEFGAREAALKAQESELADLRKKAQSFPAEMDKAVQATEKSVREKIETHYKHQAEMLQKEIEGERRLHQQTVVSLEAKIKEKDALIAQLTQKTNDAGQQVQDIALKAIDGASKLRVIREWPEKERTQEKG